MAVRASVVQRVQIGPEVTPGTAVAAGKLLTAYDWEFEPKENTKQFTGTGQMYPSASEYLYGETGIKATGQGDFAQEPYILSSLFGPATVALVSPSSTVYGWTFIPPLAGPKSKKTFTMMTGDGTNNAEKFVFCHFPEWGYSATRKQEFASTATGLAQQFIEGITLTANPTEVALSPMTGAMADFYLDTSSGGLGGTKLTDCLKADFKASGYWLPYYPFERTQSSFSDILDGMPKNELKLTLQANAAGLGLISTYLRTGVRAYIRVEVIGPTIDGTNSLKAQRIHDMCCFMSSAAALSDVDGVFAYETTWQVALDRSWGSGQAQQIVYQNLISAL